MRLLPVDNPPNPWASTHVDWVGEPPTAGLTLLEDASRSILSENDSPDVPFRYSLNPYRGCFHGCAYCYARPSHEWLGLGAGTDFERTIVVKRRAPELLREAFAKPSWKGETIAVSGVTDAWQPIEASLGLTRACLEVALEHRNPIGIVTKSPLVERDLDVLVALHEVTDVWVTISVPFFDEAHARALEPFVATPARRLATIAKLARAGLRVGVNVAPVVPGLGDEDVARVLEAAAEAGATHAAMIMLRLPGHVRDVFEARLRAALPLRAERVLARTRDVRGGRPNDPRFGTRMTGEGVYAEAVRALFVRTAERLGLRTGERDAGDAPRASTFRRPPKPRAQLSLFDADDAAKAARRDVQTAIERRRR